MSEDEGQAASIQTHADPYANVHTPAPASSPNSEAREDDDCRCGHSFHGHLSCWNPACECPEQRDEPTLAEVWEEGFDKGCHYASADLSHATYRTPPPDNPYWNPDPPAAVPAVLPTARDSVILATRGNKRRYWMRGTKGWSDADGNRTTFEHEADLLDPVVVVDAAAATQGEKP